jgi:hypothetical protein
MSRKEWIPLAVIVPPAGLLWAWSASVKGSIGDVFSYAIAGAATGVLLGTTARAFASAPVNGASLGLSGALGFAILTPLLAALMNNATDVVITSVVLLVATISIATIAGALWSIIDQMGQAFNEWRDGHRPFTPGGAHR